MEKDKVEIIENEGKGQQIIVNGVEIKNVIGYSLVDNKGIDKWGKEITIKIWHPEIEYKKGR
ncbi:hypothetical protein [Clostridium sp.]|uniref:hypothetical protein n=1 Tax=Clostridium sp. TaxID=1506 RepID=UPI001ECF95D4|nr:hypothetical protein [Clostridium sp.]MBS5885161.1 hypothetical protein [Clostridium sp.]